MTTYCPLFDTACTNPGRFDDEVTVPAVGSYDIRLVLLPKNAFAPLLAYTIEFGLNGRVTAVPATLVVVSIGINDVPPLFVARTCVALVPFTLAVTTLLNTELSPALQTGGEQEATIPAFPASTVLTIPV